MTINKAFEFIVTSNACLFTDHAFYFTAPDLLNKFYRLAKNTENIPHWFEQSSQTENLGISQFNLN